jgi:hypothetical protein
MLIFPSPNPPFVVCGVGWKKKMGKKWVIWRCEPDLVIPPVATSGKGRRLFVLY